MTCYDLAKEDQLDADMMILFFELSMPQKDCLSISKPEPMIPFDPVKARKMMFLNS